MPVLHPELVYHSGGLHAGQAVEYSAETGRILRVRPAAADDDATPLPGRVLLPGFVNAHSHAFQRLMRGRTQWRPDRVGADFWSWRSAMYDTALALDTDAVYTVSRFCFLEMLRAGFTSVGEFHYLHRQPAGDAYADATTLAKAVITAAEDVGLRIRLLYVAYATGGIGQPLAPEQRRFATPALDDYFAEVRELAAWTEGRPLANAGVAPHSVRAVPVEWLAPIHAFAREHMMPFHIHASEQPAEVGAAEAAFGRRPVELLAEQGVLDENTTVVHATHITPREIALLGAGATVCACPTTERDLGDGFLAAEELLAGGAAIALGSDSQTVIDPFEEMRLVEYHERLRKLRRVVLARTDAGRAEVANTLIDMATRAGAWSLRLPAGEIAPGALADFVAIDLTHPVLAGWTQGTLCALLTLCAPAAVVTDVWVGGVQRIAARRHALDEDALSAFRALARTFD